MYLGWEYGYLGWECLGWEYGIWDGICAGNMGIRAGNILHVGWEYGYLPCVPAANLWNHSAKQVNPFPVH